MNPGTYAATTLGVIGLLWILLTQIRVQECNYYSGSLSLTNVAARLLHWLPGRGFFVILIGVLAFLLALFGITNHLAQVLTFMGAFLFATIGILMYYLLIHQRRLLKEGSVWVEHRRGYLRSWGIPAMTGLVVGCAAGAVFMLLDYPAPYGGMVGILVSAFGAPLVAAVMVALSSKMGDPQYLIERLPPVDWRDTNLATEEELQAPDRMVECGKCGNAIMKCDAVQCPCVDSEVLCSSCCAAHSTCKDVCKTEQWSPKTETPSAKREEVELVSV
jgi:cytosine permease